MYWIVLILNSKGQAETYEFKTQEAAEQVYTNHARMCNDKYVVMLACQGKTCVPVYTCYNKIGI